MTSSPLTTYWPSKSSNVSALNCLYVGTSPSLAFAAVPAAPATRHATAIPAEILLNPENLIENPSLTDRSGLIKQPRVRIDKRFSPPHKCAALEIAAFCTAATV